MIKQEPNWIFFFFSTHRPEVKENKEGADTEKAAEQSAEPEELVKEKVCAHDFNVPLWLFVYDESFFLFEFFKGRRKNRREQRKGSSSAVKHKTLSGYSAMDAPLVKEYDLNKDRDCFFSFLFESVLGFFFFLKYAKILNNWLKNSKMQRRLKFFWWYFYKNG